MSDILSTMFSRSLVSVSLMIALAATITAGAGNATLDYPKPISYVNDFGNVIDVDSKDRLNALCTELDRKTHAQFAIVTIDTLHGVSLERYATSLFNKWGIGHKDDNRGILILLVAPEFKDRIEIGRGFEALFPNEQVEKINAEMLPDLKMRHYGQALLHGTRILAATVAQERGVKLDELRLSSTP